MYFSCGHSHTHRWMSKSQIWLWLNHHHRWTHIHAQFSVLLGSPIFMGLLFGVLLTYTQECFFWLCLLCNLERSCSRDLNVRLNQAQWAVEVVHWRSQRTRTSFRPPSPHRALPSGSARLLPRSQFHPVRPLITMPLLLWRLCWSWLLSSWIQLKCAR